TDIAKISRKQSKPDKHGHGNRIECTRARRLLSKITKVRQQESKKERREVLAWKRRSRKEVNEKEAKERKARRGEEVEMNLEDREGIMDSRSKSQSY
ncbi:hypothetical protein Tco_0308227, partial [Tanacetum coccineum]